MVIPHTSDNTLFTPLITADEIVKVFKEVSVKRKKNASDDEESFHISKAQFFTVLGKLGMPAGVRIGYANALFKELDQQHR